MDKRIEGEASWDACDNPEWEVVADALAENKIQEAAEVWYQIVMETGESAPCRVYDALWTCSFSDRFNFEAALRRLFAHRNSNVFQVSA